LIGALTPLQGVFAQTADSGATTAQQLAEQDQRIKVLERKLELQAEADAAAAASTATVKAGPSGFSLNSADGKNVFKLRGTFNLDGRYFKDFDPAFASSYASADGWVLRKIRPYFEGTFNGNYDFRFQPDFAGGKTVILDAYIAGRLKPRAVVTAGKFKSPVGLERLQTETYNRFVELGFPSSLVPNRDIGLQFSGAVGGGALSYAAAYVGGVIDGNGAENNPTADSDTDNKREVAARIFAQPFINSGNYYLRGFGIGIGASTGTTLGNATTTSTGTNGTTTPPTTAVVTTVTTNTWLPSYRSPGQVGFFSYRGDTATSITVNEAVYANGTHSRLSPQAYYYFGSFGVLSEYAQTKQAVRHVTATTDTSATLKNKAWQVAAVYLITGEDESYGAVVPQSNFAIGKPGSGAWELAARYQKLDIDDAAFTGGAASFADPTKSVTAATGYGVAVNWYLNQNVRWTLEYDQTSFKGGAGTAANITDRAAEKSYTTRFALAF
jgi:phosphate-selective porin OprO/OprP